MTGMMRGSRFNSQCPCCNDDVCDGFRTREKNAWKREAMDELQTIDPYIMVVSPEEWEQLNKAINQPPKASEGLKKLFGLKPHLTIIDEDE